MKLAYLDIRETSIPFSNPYWAGIIPKNLLSFVQFHREPVTLAHSIAGRYLLWKLLLQLDMTDVDNLNIGKTENGKIFFPDKNLHFNISHSGDMVVCALSDDSPMGIDIEHMLHVSFADFRNIMSDIEWRMINGSGSVIDFYRLWTKKEAVCKAEGIGLFDDLYQLNPGVGGCLFKKTNKFWHLQEIQLLPEYCCHLATQKLIKLDLKKVFPEG
jgi:4'-phosphopantetheinyl transferase